VVVALGSGLLLRAENPQAVGTWAPTGAVSGARTGAAAVTYDVGLTLVIGGLAGGTPTASVAAFDPPTNILAPVGALLAPRVNAAATVIADERVLVTGGTVDGEPRADAEMFDLATGTATPAGSMAPTSSSTNAE
jgi:hypothetical protein